MNLSTFISFLKARDFRNTKFRILYELKRRSGILQLNYPTKYDCSDFISLDDFRKSDKFFFMSKETLTIEKNGTDSLKETFEKVLNGRIPYFSNLWYDENQYQDWVTNPDTGYKYDVSKHWTKIEDIVESAGDIKFVWERSRFCFIYYVMRYDYHFDDDHAEFVFQKILDWINKNPLNCGPNYKCSQEISIRILNWTFALNFYKNSKALTEERLKIILNSIYWQIKHVEENINFSRYCVRNNHAITETLTLYLTSLIYPYFPEAKERKKKGKVYFETEIDYQIAEDGSFIQESMNYHRVLIQLLTWAIAIAEKHNESYSELVYTKALKTLNFLYQCQDEKTGWLPNYGANDGALFFPLNDNNYRDYRPQLDALHLLLTGVCLYENAMEDSSWYSRCIIKKKVSQLQRQYGIVRFESSGYYLIRESDTLSFFRCGKYNNRDKGGNDTLHLDVWYKGHNILTDAGSYKYNTTLDKLLYFNGNEGHNTLMVDKLNYMRKGIRFIWNNPVDVEQVFVNEDEVAYEISASIKAFTYNEPSMLIHRTVTKKKDEAIWEIKDEIKNKPAESIFRQLWHTHANEIHIESDDLKGMQTGMESIYYGSFADNCQIECATKDNIIKTVIYSKI